MSGITSISPLNGPSFDGPDRAAARRELLRAASSVNETSNGEANAAATEAAANRTSTTGGILPGLGGAIDVTG